MYLFIYNFWYSFSCVFIYLFIFLTKSYVIECWKHFVYTRKLILFNELLNEYVYRDDEWNGGAVERVKKKRQRRAAVWWRRGDKIVKNVFLKRRDLFGDAVWMWSSNRFFRASRATSVMEASHTGCCRWWTTMMGDESYLQRDRKKRDRLALGRPGSYSGGFKGGGA